MFNKHAVEALGTTDKESLVSRFRNNPASGLVLMSASITEGLDFKHDICRAQIIVKAPIPYMGDAYVEGKCKGVPDIDLVKDDTYIDRLIFIAFCQAYGRVMRDQNDWGETYVLDLTMTRKLAQKFGVTIPGERTFAGSMKDFNLEYIREGLRLKHVNGRTEFVWPVGGDVISRPYLK